MRKLLFAAAFLAVSSAPALAYDYQFIGEIRAFPYDFCPKDWVRAAGQIMPIGPHHILFSLLGNRYGGDGKTTFALPDLQSVELVSRDEHGRKPVEKVRWCIAMKGLYPMRPE